VLLDKQTEKAKLDIQELTRDLSTYESKFGFKNHEFLALSLKSI